jgi:CheY-like chemotaxis protein
VKGDPRPAKILIVEDEPLIRLGIVIMLERSGFDAIEADTADEAIKIIEARGDIRLVVTDVDMPGTMDGVRLAHYIRSKWPPIKLIVISGKVGLSTIDLPPGARFFSKPYEDATLLNTIDRMIAGNGNGNGGGNGMGAH